MDASGDNRVHKDAIIMAICKCCNEFMENEFRQYYDESDGHFHMVKFKSYKNPNICFTCNFWNERVEYDKNPEPFMIPFVCNGEHYIADVNPDHESDYFKGFGGSKIKVTFTETGETRIFDNVWYQGEIPDNFRNILKDNATMEWL